MSVKYKIIALLLLTCSVTDYRPTPEEILEDENFYIDGESMVNDDKLPARTLNDFSIYLFDTRELISPNFNTDQQVQGASGVASTHFLGR